MQDLFFRLFGSSDDVVQVNALLLAAYRALAESGMRYAASYEDVEATKRHIRSGECHLAILHGGIVGCVVLRFSARKPAWYTNPGVASFGRFAVSPSLQGKGVGSRLLNHIESRARSLGYKELALDTSEKAIHLIQMYEKRGYRFIGHHQWEVTNYRSVVMSKTL